MHATLEKKTATPCAICRAHGARFHNEALVNLCARCRNNGPIMASLVRPKKPNAVC